MSDTIEVPTGEEGSPIVLSDDEPEEKMHSAEEEDAGEEQVVETPEEAEDVTEAKEEVETESKEEEKVEATEEKADDWKQDAGDSWGNEGWGNSGGGWREPEVELWDKTFECSDLVATKGDAYVDENKKRKFRRGVMLEEGEEFVYTPEMFENMKSGSEEILGLIEKEIESFNERVEGLKVKAEGLGEKYEAFRVKDAEVANVLTKIWRQFNIDAGLLPADTKRNPPLPPLVHRVMEAREPAAWEKAKMARTAGGGGGGGGGGSWDRGGGGGSSWDQGGSSWGR